MTQHLFIVNKRCVTKNTKDINCFVFFATKDLVLNCLQEANTSLVHIKDEHITKKTLKILLLLEKEELYNSQSLLEQKLSQTSSSMEAPIRSSEILSSAISSLI